MTKQQIRNLQRHPQHTAADLRYLTDKGYTYQEILDIWNEDLQSGKEPCKLNKNEIDWNEFNRRTGRA